MSRPEFGAVAPDFTLKNQHGEDITLSEFRDKSAVVLVFLPFAFSGVCTGELGELRDRSAELTDAKILAVTCDHFFSNRAWAEQEAFDFHVLSDFWPHGSVSERYGTFDDTLGAAKRGSFVIDRNGIVRWSVANALSDARSVDDYRAAIAAL